MQPRLVTGLLLEDLADYLGGTSQVRRLVVQLAVSGRLVGREPAEGDARVLVEEARAEQERLLESKRTYPEEQRPPLGLPLHWRWVRLGDIVRDQGQGVPDKQFSYIDVGSIDNVRGTLGSSLAVVEPAAAPSRARKRVAVGSVVYSTVRPYLLNVAVVEALPNPEPIASTAFAVLHPLAGIESRYLFHVLRSPYFVAYVEAEMKGMAYPAINDQKLYAAWIPLPPLGEQRRIVGKIEQLTVLCDDLDAKRTYATEIRIRLTRAAMVAARDARGPGSGAVEARQRVISHLDELLDSHEAVEVLRDSIFLMAARGLLATRHVWPSGGVLSEHGPIPVGWSWTTLGNVAERVDAGWSPKCENNPTTRDSDWGVLKTTSVQRAEFLPQHHKALPKGLAPRPDIAVREGDVLVTRAGPTARVGVACHVPEVRDRLMLSDKIIRVRLKPNLVDGEFAAVVLNTGPSQAFLRASQSGMDLAQVNISQERLRRTPFPLAPLPAQKAIVAAFKRLHHQCGVLEEHLVERDEGAIRLAEALVASFVG